MKLFKVNTTYDPRPIVEAMADLSVHRLNELRNDQRMYDATDAFQIVVPSFSFGRRAGHTTAATAYAVHHKNALVVTPNRSHSTQLNKMSGREVAVPISDLVDRRGINVNEDVVSDAILLFDSCRLDDVKKCLIDHRIMTKMRGAVMINTVMV